MADRDPAFQWETEALRAAAQRRRDDRPTSATLPPIEPGWVTLRQAAGATGIPVGTLRRWARQGALPSQSQETHAGARRLVWLDAVLDRADTLGRTGGDAPSDTEAVARPEPVSERSSPPPPPPPLPRPERERPVEIPGQQQLVSTDERPSETVAVPEPTAVEEGGQRGEDGSQPQPQPLGPGEPAAAPPEPPSGTMLVPVDAWNKMLLQLGNLHEAGRELAEARERAAKAETEATFLRERLKDLRERTDAERSPAVREKRRRWFGSS